MLSPVSTTGHLIGRRKRQPRLEFALVLLNVAAYTFACVSVLAAL